jgi:hypothetical protein
MGKTPEPKPGPPPAIEHLFDGAADPDAPHEQEENNRESNRPAPPGASSHRRGIRGPERGVDRGAC